MSNLWSNNSLHILQTVWFAYNTKKNLPVILTVCCKLFYFGNWSRFIFHTIPSAWLPISTITSSTGSAKTCIWLSLLRKAINGILVALISWNYEFQNDYVIVYLMITHFPFTCFSSNGTILQWEKYQEILIHRWVLNLTFTYCFPLLYCNLFRCYFPWLM